jgi:hypothetical protein
VTQSDVTQAEPQPEISPIDLEKQSRQSMQALSNLVARISPWLFAFGSWIFGGLIAFNLVVTASLFTIGPIHPAIMVSLTAFACALPLNVAGLFLLKLIQEMKDVNIDEQMLQAFQDAGFPIEAYVPPSQERASLYKRRTKVALSYSTGILAFSVVLTLTGLVAVLWYMAWWVGVVFFAIAMLSPVLVIAVIVHSLPPESEAEKELKRRFREQQTRQRQEQRKTKRDR